MFANLEEDIDYFPSVEIFGLLYEYSPGVGDGLSLIVSGLVSLSRPPILVQFIYGTSVDPASFIVEFPYLSGILQRGLIVAPSLPDCICHGIRWHKSFSFQGVAAASVWQAG